MKKNICTLLFFAILFFNNIFAQETKTQTKGTTVNIQSLKFKMDAPTNDFILDKAGTSYQWAGGNAMLQYIAMPGKYENMSGSIEAMYASPDMTLLFNEKMKYAGQEGDLMKVKTKAAKESGQEDFFFLVFLMPHEHGFVMLSSSYPVSQDNDLYHKILQSFDSFHEVKN